MDIVNVVANQIRAKLEKEGLEINSVLANPTEQGALNRLELAVKRYAEYENQLAIVKRLSAQMDGDTAEKKDEN